jgi:hypothetical protein
MHPWKHKLSVVIDIAIYNACNRYLAWSPRGIFNHFLDNKTTSAFRAYCHIS